METSKDKLFAQYWGQKVALYYENIFNYDFEFPKHWFNDTKLELKSLSNLSREDAIFLYCSKNGLHRQERVSLVEYSFSNNILGIEISSPDYSTNLTPKDYFPVDGIPSKLTDYMRSKGYAMPYMGLSVEKQIEYGWVVLE